MRVLHIQKAKGISGSERHLLTLLPGLRDAGIDVRVCVVLAGDGLRFVDALRALELDVTVVPAGPDLNPLLAARLIGVIRAVRPDVVHTHLVHADLHGLVAARAVGVPGVSSVHTPPSYYRHPGFRWAERLAGRLARERIAISRHVERSLLAEHQARPGRVVVVPYGIDAGRWSGVDRDRARSDFGVNDVDDANDVIVGIASRLVEGKGHALLFDAMTAATAHIDRLHLLVAGDGELRGELEVKATTLRAGLVRFLGFVEDMPTFMAACDILAFPTAPERDEGFGLVALEAMAAARAVIATDFGPIPEVVDHDTTGVLVAPGSAAALAHALVLLGNDRGRREQMGEAGSARAITEFSVERMVEDTIAVYRRVLSA